MTTKEQIRKEDLVIGDLKSQFVDRANPKRQEMKSYNANMIVGAIATAYYRGLQQDKDESPSPNTSLLDALQAKVDFYRETTDRVRKLVYDNKDIGNPGQPLYDAIVDKINSQAETIKQQFDALKELVAVKDFKDNKYESSTLEMRRDYFERLPLAWEAARKLIAEAEGNETINHCTCPPETKTGQTSVMCCNVCGKPDEQFWTSHISTLLPTE